MALLIEKVEFTELTYGKVTRVDEVNRIEVKDTEDKTAPKRVLDAADNLLHEDLLPLLRVDGSDWVNYGELFSVVWNYDKYGELVGWGYEVRINQNPDGSHLKTPIVLKGKSLLDKVEAITQNRFEALRYECESWADTPEELPLMTLLKGGADMQEATG